ncbi:hypothetical protein [Amycolatopsis sp. NPDC004079]|uniref:hypothetical protein n=1 Tax=Amycolatopsis sp. NPDC004079 TaxID=3154549 RepID=UPI0033B7F807
MRRELGSSAPLAPGDAFAYRGREHVFYGHARMAPHGPVRARSALFLARRPRKQLDEAAALVRSRTVAEPIVGSADSRDTAQHAAALYGQVTAFQRDFAEIGARFNDGRHEADHVDEPESGDDETEEM